MHTARAIEAFAGLGVVEACAGRGAQQTGGTGQIRQDRDESGPESAQCFFYVLLHLLRHTLGVVVDQHESWLLFAINDVVGCAGDNVRVRCVVQFFSLRLTVTLATSGTLARKVPRAMAWLVSSVEMSSAKS